MDVGFRVVGGPVPLDHGYLLFGALSNVLGDLHNANWLAVHPLYGLPRPDGMLALPRGRPVLRIRVAMHDVARLLPLAGQCLDLRGRRCTIGIAHVSPLIPAPALAARVVTIKGFTEEEPFAGALQRQLAERGVHAAIEIGRRRVVTVAGDRIVGFAVRLRDLTPEDSLRVQGVGLGGRRRMGCGVHGAANAAREPMRGAGSPIVPARNHVVPPFAERRPVTRGHSPPAVPSGIPRPWLSRVTRRAGAAGARSPWLPCRAPPGSGSKAGSKPGPLTWFRGESRRLTTRLRSPGQAEALSDA